MGTFQKYIPLKKFIHNLCINVYVHDSHTEPTTQTLTGLIEVKCM